MPASWPTSRSSPATRSRSTTIRATCGRSSSGAGSPVTSPAEHGSPHHMIMEFRTYTMVPGARAEFVEFFKTQAMPLMAAVGMNVVGQFSSVTDENVFAYARTFDSIEQREAQYKAYYESEDWLG